MSDTFVLFAIGFVMAVYLFASMAWDVRAFRERFPPISDAEFLARCKPGTSPEVAFKVRRIVAEHFAVEYERIYPDTNFVDDLGVA